MMNRKLINRQAALNIVKEVIAKVNAQPMKDLKICNSAGWIVLFAGSVNVVNMELIVIRQMIGNRSKNHKHHVIASVVMVGVKLTAVVALMTMTLLNALIIVCTDVKDVESAFVIIQEEIFAQLMIMRKELFKLRKNLDRKRCLYEFDAR